MKKVQKEKIANEIIRSLYKEGWDAYIVGGAARDLLMGQKPDDYDVATNAPYEAVLKLFGNRKKTIVGTSFKVLLIDGIEVATFRKNNKSGTKKYKIEAESSITIHDDLARRDLTINALAICPYNGKVIDDHDGISDLKSRIIRFTGNPAERILEDPCRILRACRFLAKLDGKFDYKTKEAMIMNRELVKDEIASERIRLEILKAVQYPKPSLFFDALHDIGVLKYISNGFESCYGHDGGNYHGETVGEHIKMVGDFLPSRKPILRIAGYWHDHGKPAAAEIRPDGISFINHARIGAEIAGEELKRLNFSNREISYVKTLILHHMKNINVQDKPKKVRRHLKTLKDHGIEWKDWFQLKIADTKGNLKKQNLQRKQIQSIVLKIRNELKQSARPLVLSTNDLAVNGNDVMNILNIKSGPRVGELLHMLLYHVIDDPSLNKKEILYKMISEERYDK